MKRIKFIFLNLISVSSIAAMEQSPESLLFSQPLTMGGYSKITPLQPQESEPKNQATDQIALDLENFDGAVEFLTSALTENPITDQLDANLENIESALTSTLAAPDEIENQPKQINDVELTESALADALAAADEIENQPKQSAKYKYTCNQEGCNHIQFKNKQEFNGHNKKEHLELAQYSCDICSQSYNTAKYLKQHQCDQHPELFKYVCNQGCNNERFKTQRAFSNHKKVKHSESSKSHDKPFSCAICSKPYGSLTGLAYHKEKKHPKLSAEYKYACNKKDCNEKFNTPQELKQHKKTHAGSQNSLFSCDICQISYKQQTSLIKHQSKEHPELSKHKQPAIDPIVISNLGKTSSAALITAIQKKKHSLNTNQSDVINLEADMDTQSAAKRQKTA